MRDLGIVFLAIVLEGGELDLREFKNVEKMNVNRIKFKSPLTKLNLTGLSNLNKLECLDNNLTSIDFLNQLPNPEKLKELQIYNNNIQPTDISFFSKFVNLKILRIGTMEDSLKNGKHNKFYGSLKSYQNLTKLEEICIEATDVNEGLEYLPESLVKANKANVNKYSNIECQTYNTNAKCKAIQDQLRPFNYDLEAWQLAHPERMVKVWKEKYSDKEQLVKDLETKITQTKTELATAKEQEADKTKKIARLENKLKLLEEAKTKLENELAQEKQAHNTTKQNHKSQLKELTTIIFPSNSDISSISFSDLKEQVEKVKQEKQTLQENLTNFGRSFSDLQTENKEFLRQKTELEIKLQATETELTDARQKIQELETNKYTISQQTQTDLTGEQIEQQEKEKQEIVLLSIIQNKRTQLAELITKLNQKVGSGLEKVLKLYLDTYISMLKEKKENNSTFKEGQLVPYENILVEKLSKEEIQKFKELQKEVSELEEELNIFGLEEKQLEAKVEILPK